MMRILVFIPLIAASTSVVSSEETIPDPLEKAVHTEETVGDLEAAIQIYEQVVGHADLLDSYAAKALYRMALCYEKIGNEAEAKRSLYKLITHYPDQAKPCRPRLAATQRPATSRQL
jgi:tetratricopeptide (TPR) repeat protein